MFSLAIAAKLSIRGASDRIHQDRALFLFYGHEFKSVTKAVAIAHFGRKGDAWLPVAADEFHDHIVIHVEINGKVSAHAAFAHVVSLAVDLFSIFPRE